ncbi:MAG: nitroreductase family deazaflavin-dependent oxidoreductase [Mycobacteriaceae bacterium]|nr:nitroreductase family deazaflavin-dependent oxidoreductase [Mycobacteriaceae bacterium]
MDANTRYIAPSGRFEAAMHRSVAFLARRGISLVGSRELAVRGRTSGEWRTVPVNLLVVDGERYLIAVRGNTQWVRNIRVAGGGELRLGRKTESFTVTEIANADKLPTLREYLRKWGWEVGQFFPGLPKNPSDAELAEIAPGVPVFRIA